ncbi:MAG: hypothetical protein KGV59_06335 [Tenacibaculum sp.]|nr:hypothetical protein [Tenacibaculum sp.]
MKALEITKLERVENTDKEMLSQGIVAFQLVKFVVNFFGNKVESILDTKIMSDGRQFVIDGDGFIEQGFEVK